MTLELLVPARNSRGVIENHLDMRQLCYEFLINRANFDVLREYAGVIDIADLVLQKHFPKKCITICVKSAAIEAKRFTMTRAS